MYKTAAACNHRASPGLHTYYKTCTWMLTKHGTRAPTFSNHQALDPADSRLRSCAETRLENSPPASKGSSHEATKHKAGSVLANGDTRKTRHHAHMPNRRPGGEWAWIFCIKPQIVSLKAGKRLLKSFVNLAQSINVRNFSLSVVKLSKVGTYRKRGECHQQKGNKPLGFVTHQNFIETYSPAHSEDRFNRN